MNKLIVYCAQQSRVRPIRYYAYPGEKSCSLKERIGKLQIEIDAQRAKLEKQERDIKIITETLKFIRQNTINVKKK